MLLLINGSEVLLCEIIVNYLPAISKTIDHGPT